MSKKYNIYKNSSLELDYFYNLVSIKTASSSKIKQWVDKILPNGKVIGEVTNANTLHHKTFLPSKGGLFCQRIFGPIKDYTCACGKTLKDNNIFNSSLFTSNFININNSTFNTNTHYNYSNGFRSSFKTRQYCPICDVEYTLSIVRRYSLGYIKLVSPVIHNWYYKGFFNLLFDIKKAHLESITYALSNYTIHLLYTFGNKYNILYNLYNNNKGIYYKKFDKEINNRFILNKYKTNNISEVVYNRKQWIALFTIFITKVIIIPKGIIIPLGVAIPLGIATTKGIVIAEAINNNNNNNNKVNSILSIINSIKSRSISIFSLNNKVNINKNYYYLSNKYKRTKRSTLYPLPESNKTTKNSLYNLLYTISHREIWTPFKEIAKNKDWQNITNYLLLTDSYYYTSNNSLTNAIIPIASYKERLKHPSFLTLPITPGSLYKSLFIEWTPTELKKIDKMNNILLNIIKNTLNSNSIFNSYSINSLNKRDLIEDSNRTIVKKEYNRYKNKAINNNSITKENITLLHTPGGMAKHSDGVLKSSHPADILHFPRDMAKHYKVHPLRDALWPEDKGVFKSSVYKTILGLISKVNIDLVLERSRLIRKMAIRGIEASSLFIKYLPVLPPDLRPILQIGDKVALSDINILYSKVIHRNIRLKKLLNSSSIDSSITYSFSTIYAYRILHEAVDKLISNKGNKAKSSYTAGEKDTSGIKSLSSILKGKSGRFRSNLLGKRVDYSGRSVIVVGPSLKLHQCGLPFEMAITLYFPLLLNKIIKNKKAKTVGGAKALIKKDYNLIWEYLREIIDNYPILLNRAPTLHRLGIQAFMPVLVEGKAILLHPLVCTGFNADFDGDQMAVHLPISSEGRAEALKLMCSRNNFLSPATGEPLAIPSQDMVLGCYYLTTTNSIYNMYNSKGTGSIFSNIKDVIKAYNNGLLDIHSIIWLKLPINTIIEGNTNIINKNNKSIKELRINSSGKLVEVYGINKISTYYTLNENKIRYKEISKYISTTPGRVLFNTNN